jgi:hypothetical protein
MTVSLKARHCEPRADTSERAIHSTYSRYPRDTYTRHSRAGGNLMMVALLQDSPLHGGPTYRNDNKRGAGMTE